MEKKMLTTIAISLTVGLVVGGFSGAGLVGAFKKDKTPEVVEAVDDVVESVGDAANEERLAELDVSRELAKAPTTTLVCMTAAEEGATNTAVALCAYGMCLSHVEGQETSAGLGCPERGKVLDELLREE